MQHRLVIYWKTYPVSPYLDSKDSLVRWAHFIHNKINKKLEKDQISIGKFYTEYYKQYETITEQQITQIKTKKHIVYALLIVFLLGVIFILHRELTKYFIIYLYSNRQNGWWMVIGSGGFGCVFQPSLQCDDKDNNATSSKKKITKLMTKQMQ